MSIDKEAVPGGGNIFNQEFHIGHVENLNPAATTVVNNYYGTKARSRDDSPEPADRESVRKEILQYVETTYTYVDLSWKDKYMALWADILDLPEVKSKVYDAGKQWGTNFNRDLVANILYHLRARKIYAVVYRDNYNGAKMAEYLEGNKEHTVKHALRDEPAKEIREAIDTMLKNKY
jgi:hypothetical protein